MNAIDLESVTVRRGGFELSNVTAHVPEGSTVFVMGPNGSGKSSLLFVILGFLKPTAGAARVSGQDPFRRSRSLVRELGYVPDSHDEVLEQLTGSEYLNLHRRLKSRSRDERRRWESEAERLGDLLGLTSFSGRIAGYSHGMRKKIQVIAALQSGPSLLVLDEPFNGLDLRSQAALEAALAAHTENGGSVLAAIHAIEPAQRCADAIMFLGHGAPTYMTDPTSAHLAEIVGGLR